MVGYVGLISLRVVEFELGADGCVGLIAVCGVRSVDTNSGLLLRC
jgi:hypothetical protein